MNQVLLLILVGVLSGLFTAALLVITVMIWWRRQGRQQLGHEVETIGENLQEKVRLGVKQGISDGIEGLPQDVVKSTTRTVTQTGLDIVEEGISTLLGSNRKK